MLAVSLALPTSSPSPSGAERWNRIELAIVIVLLVQAARSKHEYE
ncbi:MAG: hypothetical protein ABIZ49_03765 [Opitutaceae bacterium]